MGALTSSLPTAARRTSSCFGPPVKEEARSFMALAGVFAARTTWAAPPSTAPSCLPASNVCPTLNKWPESERSVRPIPAPSASAHSELTRAPLARTSQAASTTPASQRRAQRATQPLGSSPAASSAPQAALQTPSPSTSALLALRASTRTPPARPRARSALLASFSRSAARHSASAVIRVDTATPPRRAAAASRRAMRERTTRRRVAARPTPVSSVPVVPSARPPGQTAATRAGAAAPGPMQTSPG
mmetsp:Transcript_7180/g.20557  ORF Transcript_7180/g.20557 Transcript_7180/m.20557 type:complete len:246 (+) Transcript_7180:944-1681(+)